MTSLTTTRTPWFAVQTRYRYEQRIASDLSSKGLESYLPTLREVHEWKDRSRPVDVPAFGGYLFVRCEASLQDRVRVLETTGVVKILGSGQPEPVSETEIESLRLSLNSGAPCTRHPYIAIGTLLRIERGPLARLEGRVVRTANAMRLVICVASLGQAIAIEVPRDDVNVLDALEVSYQSQLHRRESSACELLAIPTYRAREDRKILRSGRG
jgi:transcription antitermination factor NusG